MKSSGLNHLWCQQSNKLDRRRLCFHSIVLSPPNSFSSIDFSPVVLTCIGVMICTHQCRPLSWQGLLLVARTFISSLGHQDYVMSGSKAPFRPNIPSPTTTLYVTCHRHAPRGDMWIAHSWLVSNGLWPLSAIEQVEQVESSGTSGLVAGATGLFRPLTLSITVASPLESLLWTGLKAVHLI